MTVSSQTSRIEQLGDGTTTAFAVNFYFLENSDLKVFVNGVLQTITTNYTVIGAGNPAGGTVTFVSAPANGVQVVIFRDPALTQGLDYIDNDPFPAESHERGLDKLTMIVQRVKDLVSRALRLGDSVVGVSTELPALSGGQLLGTNPGGTGFQLYPLGSEPDTAANIAYTPAGTGAVATTVEAELNLNRERDALMPSLWDYLDDAEKADIQTGSPTIDLSPKWVTCLAENDSFTLPPGTLGLGDTVIIGNNKQIIGAGSESTIIKMLSGFGTTDKKPMFALNANYDDPANDAYNIDSFLMRGVTIEGLASVNASGYPTTLVGPSGLDITWTKDDIALEDVYFRLLNRGVTKTDSTRADVVHWGIRVRGGGAFSCYRAYEVFPSLGSFDETDIQTCNQGIDVSASNITSSVMWLNDLRIENNRSHTLPDTSGFHIRTTSRAEISGYFEGGVRHILIQGGNNCHTTIKPSQFSRCSQDAAQTVLGVPILYDTNSDVPSLTLLNVQGVVSGNHQAFIETGAGAVGTINWVGMGGNQANIFKNSAGTLSTYPDQALSIVYNNNQVLRGLIQQRNILKRGNEIEWSGNAAGFSTKRYTFRINKTALGANDILTFTGKSVGVLRVALMDPSAPATYSHQVFEFYTQADGTVVAVPTVNVAAGSAPVVSASLNKFIVTIASATFTTLAVSLDITTENQSPDAVVTLN